MRGSFKEVFWFFLKLGATGFGGPIALIAIMEQEAVRVRGWLTESEFAEAYAICKLLPGPVAVQMSIHLGYRRCGRRGGIVSGLAFTAPSFLMVLAFSIFYVKYSLSRRYFTAFGNMQAGALALIALSTVQLAKPYVGKGSAIVIAAISAVAIFLHPTYEPLLILVWGLLGAYFRVYGGKPPKLPLMSLWGLGVAPVVEAPGLALAKYSEPMSRLGELFWVCFKSGEFVFGTGLAIIPLLEGEFVQNLHWLTHAEFMDGLTIGQVTPGPVTITVVFFGYKVAGMLGAWVATIGIYLPAFFNVLVILPWAWKKMSGTPAMAGFTAWAFPAVIGGIASSTLRLGASAINSWIAAAAFFLTLLLYGRWKVPAWILLPGLGVLGLLVS